MKYYFIRSVLTTTRIQNRWQNSKKTSSLRKLTIVKTPLKLPNVLLGNEIALVSLDDYLLVIRTSCYSIWLTLL